MNITYPQKEFNVAEVIVEGELYRFRIPPATGTQQDVFRSLSTDRSVTVAQGKQIAVYAAAALDPKRQNEWTNADRIRFPVHNYLRIPRAFTIVPRSPETERKRFGDLEGGMIIDLDLDGTELAKPANVPQDLSGWTRQGNIYTFNNRTLLSHDEWFADTWSPEKGVAPILLGGPEFVEMLAKQAYDSGRKKMSQRSLNPAGITVPEKRVPFLGSWYGITMDLVCFSRGFGRKGCSVGVVK